MRTALAALCLGPVLNGCSAGTTASTTTSTPASTTTSTPVAVPANLNGNWLLTGSLPFTIAGRNPPNSTFGVAMTISNSKGNELSAYVDRNEACSNGVTSGFLAEVSGTVASDGTFSMTNSSASFSATATGTVPATPPSSWTGHLDIKDNTGACASQSLDFTAVRIADVTGTYNGSAILNSVIGGTVQAPQTTLLTFTLQQGAIGPANSISGPADISGNVVAQGTTCFATGNLPIRTLPPLASDPISEVLGSLVQLQSIMNDGSVLSLSGRIMDMSSSTIYVTSVSSNNAGRCTSLSAAPFMLTKQ